MNRTFLVVVGAGVAILGYAILYDGLAYVIGAPKSTTPQAKPVTLLGGGAGFQKGPGGQIVGGKQLTNGMKRVG